MMLYFENLYCKYKHIKLIYPSTNDVILTICNIKYDGIFVCNDATNIATNVDTNIVNPEII